MGTTVTEEEEMVDAVSEEGPVEIPVPVDCREWSRYGHIKGCRCEWNAYLPYMEARRDTSKIVIYENGTGEMPRHFKNDIIYRAKSAPSFSLTAESVSQIKVMLMPVVREQGMDPERLDEAILTDIPTGISYAKEMRSQLYRHFRVKVPDTILSEIGTIARRHLESQEEEFVFSLTREYDRDPHFYLNGGSCYWDAGDNYPKSMCHCKRYGVSMMLKLAPDVTENSLAEFYDGDWERSSRYKEDREGVFFRSLVIPVDFREKRYRLAENWQRERLTRFVVANTYKHESDERVGSFSNYDAHMASLLAKVMERGSDGNNASLSDDGGSSFYINGRGEYSAKSMPIVHIGRDAPRTRFPFDCISPRGDISCGYHYGEDDDRDDDYDEDED
jgi:hypothetical protein